MFLASILKVACGTNSNLFLFALILCNYAEKTKTEGMFWEGTYESTNIVYLVISAAIFAFLWKTKYFTK